MLSLIFKNNTIWSNLCLKKSFKLQLPICIGLNICWIESCGNHQNNGSFRNVRQEREREAIDVYNEECNEVTAVKLN